MNPYVILGVAALLGISHGWVFVKGTRHERTKWEAKVAEAREEARNTEKIWQGAYNEASKNYLAKIDTVNSHLRITLNGLRDRPDRLEGLPPTPRVDCKGANGAELGRSHAEFLARYAAAAAKQDEALNLCYTSYDNLRRK